MRQENLGYAEEKLRQHMKTRSEWRQAQDLQLRVFPSSFGGENKA